MFAMFEQQSCSSHPAEQRDRYLAAEDSSSALGSASIKDIDRIAGLALLYPLTLKLESNSERCLDQLVQAAQNYEMVVELINCDTATPGILTTTLTSLMQDT